MKKAREARVDRQMNRILSTLERAIEESGASQEEIAERLGWGGGYMARILGRAEPLYHLDLMALLGVLEIHPADFFTGALASKPPERPDSQSTTTRPRSG